MKRYLSFAILLLALGSAYAQGSSAIDRQQNLEAVAGRNTNNTAMQFNNAYAGVVGSPFLAERWQRGQVLLKENKLYTNLEIKYDIYQNEIRCKNLLRGDSVILDNEQVVEFTIDNGVTKQRFKKIPVTDKNSKYPYAFFQVLNEGNISLLLLRKKELLKASYTGGYANRTYDEFISSEVFYIRKKDGSLHKVPKREKALLELLSDKSAEVKAFIAKEKPALSTEAGLAKVVEYYNTL